MSLQVGFYFNFSLSIKLQDKLIMDWSYYSKATMGEIDLFLVELR